jgi:DNA polymerase-1
VRDYLQAVVEQARKDGYTSTVLGRRRYLPELNSSNRQVREAAERAALNAPIQGSAADIIKVAMIEVDRGLRSAGLASRMLLQVHDELVWRSPTANATRWAAPIRSTFRWRCRWAGPPRTEHRMGGRLSSCPARR